MRPGGQATDERSGDYRDLYDLLESLGYRFFGPQTFAETPARRRAGVSR